MERRDMLRAVAAAAALSVLPRDAHAVWERVRASAGRPPKAGLTEAQLALVGAIADTIIPRTDTPSATDVGVPAWVDVIAAEYYTDTERTTFTTGLDAIDVLASSLGGGSFAGLSAESRDKVMVALDGPAAARGGGPQSPAVRCYGQLKRLVIHGYFTSERVQQDVLKTVIMPGRFDGNAPMPVAAGAKRGGFGAGRGNA
jgi:gluconate 2-dehydrogenase gamma chain